MRRKHEWKTWVLSKTQDQLLYIKGADGKVRLTFVPKGLPIDKGETVVGKYGDVAV